MKKFTIGIWITALVLGFSVSAFAGQYDIKEMTPSIKRAIENRQQRYDQLQQLKASGAAGEDNQGLVYALKPSAAGIASAENADRLVIYSAIVVQNGFGPSGLTQVQKAFADVQRDKARSGDFIQTSSGEWRQK